MSNMLYFCTLFDINYFARGIAMYESLINKTNDFHLFILAFDDITYELLQKWNFKNVTLISYKEFENNDLLSVKHKRTKAEYYWTCTPALVLYVLNKYDVPYCIYIDADIYWFSSPSELLNEISNCSIAITEHRYVEKIKEEMIKKFGIYCVQFVMFKNDNNGLTALKWWYNECIKWCYAKIEEGKFGDQKYLDDWPQRFKGVHVILNLGAGCAPWNVTKYNIMIKNNELYGRCNATYQEFKLVFYHFHYVKFFNDNTIELGNYHLSNDVIILIYKPYIQKLISISNKVKDLIPNIDPIGVLNKNWSLYNIIKNLKRKVKGIYNVYNLDYFLN